MHEALNVNDAKTMLKEGEVKSIIEINIADNQGSINIIEDPRYPEIQGEVKKEITNLVEDTMKNAITENAQATAEEKYKNTIDEKFAQFTDEILGQNSSPLSVTISNELESIKAEMISEIDYQISSAVSENFESTKKNLSNLLDQKITDEFDQFASNISDLLPSGPIADEIISQINSYRDELSDMISSNINSEISNQISVFQENIKEKLTSIVNQQFTIYKSRFSPTNPDSPIYKAISEEIDSFKNDLANEKIDISINAEPIKIESSDFTSKDINYFDRYASGAIPLVIVLIFLLKSATSFSQDRENGVLERLFSTPASRFKVMLAKILSNVLIGVISLIGIILMLKFVFSATLGSWWLVLLISVMTAIVSVAMGILISVITRDLASSIQFAFYTFFIIVLTSEFFFASENIYPPLRIISKINPVTYSVAALRKVNLFNWGISEIWTELLVLAGFAILYTIIALVVIDRDTK